MKEIQKATTTIRLRFFKDVPMVELVGFKPISLNLLVAALKAAASSKDMQSILKNGLPEDIDKQKVYILE